MLFTPNLECCAVPLIEIVPLEQSMLGFVQTLTYQNMQHYYAYYKKPWMQDVFEKSLAETENFAIKLNGYLAGALRLKESAEDFYICDLHVLPECQSRGLGAAGLEFVIGLARARKKRFVCLSVFRNNPAKKLYERIGFFKSQESGNLLKFQYKLP